MTTGELRSLTGFCPMAAARQLLGTSRKAVDDINLYKHQCTNIIVRCLALLDIIHGWRPRIDPDTIHAISEEVTGIVRRIDTNFTEWAGLARFRSFLQRRQMEHEIDSLNHDLGHIVTKFNRAFNLELERIFDPRERTTESFQTNDEYEEESRRVLQEIIQSPEDMDKLLHSQPPLLEDITTSLQTELRGAKLQPAQAEIFRHGLWVLFKGYPDFSKLLLQCDLTGQVRINGERAIAEGPFSVVFSGQWLDEKLVTLHLPRNLARSRDDQKRFEREVSFWRKLDHPNILSTFGSVCLENDIYAVRPWIDNGTVMLYLQRNPFVDRLNIICEIASGLEYLHLSGVIHGDLRGVNVLVSSDGIAQLSEFGLHQFGNGIRFSVITLQDDEPWLPPELTQERNSRSTYTDVWSFAIVSLEIMTGQCPLPGTNRDVMQHRSDLQRDNMPDRPGRDVTKMGLSDEIWGLLLRCWHVVGEFRPTMSSVNEELNKTRELSASPGSSDVFYPPGPSRSRPRRPSTTLSRVESPHTVQPGHHVDKPSERRRGYVHPVNSSNWSDLEKPPKAPLQTSVDDFARPSPVIDSASLYSRESTSSHPRSQPSTSSPSASHLKTSPSLPSNYGEQSRRSSPTRSLSPLKVAVNNPKTIIHFDGSGQVDAGTLEGLVENLISNSGTEADMLYRDVLFTSCTDFTSLEDLFKILVRRFTEAGDAERSPSKHQVTYVQDNIFGILRYLLTNRHLHLDSQILWQMKHLCTTSSIVGRQANNITQLINARLAAEQTPSLPLSPGRRIPRTSEIMPRDLAIALTLLEGDKYKVILPTDYIGHLEKQDRPNNVAAACQTNNRIVLWVKQSVLHYDAIDSRAQVLKFFVNTGLECRKLHNFASLTAIAIALNSAPIDRLRLTKRELPQSLRQALEEFEDLLDPSANHRTYRAALRELSEGENSHRCIPWIAVHLRELFSTLQKYPSDVEVDGVPLINFKRYTRFTARIKEVLHYVPPDLERYRQQGQLAYLEHQLRGVYMKPTVEDELMERSLALEAEETRDYRTRKRELKSLGFKT